MGEFIQIENVEECEDRRITRVFYDRDERLCFVFDDNSYLYILSRGENGEHGCYIFDDALDMDVRYEYGAISEEEYNAYCRVREEKEQAWRKEREQYDRQTFERLKSEYGWS